MTDPRQLFRPEAVEAHARGRAGEDDEGLELREGRVVWAFRTLLLVLAVGLVLALTVKVDETARGPARAGSDTLVVDLPVAALPRLRAGQPVSIGNARGEVRFVQPPAALDGAAVVPVVTTFPNDMAGETAVVRLNRRTLASLLLGRGRG